MLHDCFTYLMNSPSYGLADEVNMFFARFLHVFARFDHSHNRFFCVNETLGHDNESLLLDPILDLRGRLLLLEIDDIDVVILHQ